MSIITPLGQDLAATEASGGKRRAAKTSRLRKPPGQTPPRPRPRGYGSLSGGERRAAKTSRLRKPPAANAGRPRAPRLRRPPAANAARPRAHYFTRLSLSLPALFTHPAPRPLLHPPNPEPVATGSLPVGRPLFPWDASFSRGSASGGERRACENTLIFPARSGSTLSPASP